MIILFVLVSQFHDYLLCLGACLVYSAWMYIMDALVVLKTIDLTLFLNVFFYFLPAAALCHDFSLVDSFETLNAESNSN